MSGPYPRPMEERFWEKVNKTSTCWLWTASTARGGYGQFTVVDSLGKRNLRVHRWSYIQARGPISDDLVIDHLCRVRTCVNPSHMEAVTSATNCYRSQSPAAENALKTHCIRGHEFDDSNTKYFFRKPGEMRRACRECMRIRDRKRQSRNKKK